MYTPTEEDVKFVSEQIGSVRHHDGLSGWFRKASEGSEEDAREALSAILMMYEAGRSEVVPVCNCAHCRELRKERMD